MARVMIIEDDTMMAECIGRGVNFAGSSRHEVCYFTNAVEAMAAIDAQVPDLIILDVILQGPDGFSFLNELASYSDTAEIPVLIITSLDLAEVDLAHYGVRRVLQKETMTPGEIDQAVREILTDAA